MLRLTTKQRGASEMCGNPALLELLAQERVSDFRREAALRRAKAPDRSGRIHPGALERIVALLRALV
jgi:hypothetical protein